MRKLRVESTGFPLTNETLRFLNASTLEVMEALARTCGDKTILSGVVETDGVLSNGFIAVNGELLFFQGGNVLANVAITSAVENVNYNTDPQNSAAVASFPAYEVKTASCTASAGSFAFSDLVRLKSLKEISAGSLLALHSGTIILGQIDIAGVVMSIDFPELPTADYFVLMHFQSVVAPGEEFNIGSGVAWETRSATTTSFQLRARRIGSNNTYLNNYSVSYQIFAKP